MLVDYFNVGPAIAAVDVFNKMKSPTGRKYVTVENMEGGPGLRKTSGSEEGAPAVLAAFVIALTMAFFLI